MGLPAPVNCRSRMQCNNGNGPDMWAPMPNNGNGPVICRVFFVAFLFFFWLAYCQDKHVLPRNDERSKHHQR